MKGRRPGVCSDCGGPTLDKRARRCRKCWQRGIVGAGAPNWKGDAVRDGHGRARRYYPLDKCELCGAPATDRHHRNGDHRDNRPENIAGLCRRCHMSEDGRLARFIALNPSGWRHPRRKVSDDDVRAIRASVAREEDLARQFGISAGTAGKIRRGERYRDVGGLR